MSNYTEHYNLKKPLKSEKYDVDVANTNNDIIDEKIFGKVDKIAGKSLSSNDFTDGYKQKVDKLIEGTKGDSAYQVALKNGFEGTETQWLSSLKGDKGDTGDVSKEELKEVTENKRLKLEGKSEQDETPSPEYPSRIRNVGNNIQLFDKSLIPSNYKYNNGLKLDRDNLRTATIILTKKIKSGTYTISFEYGDNSTSNNFGIQFLNGEKGIANVTFTTEKVKTFIINKEVDRLYFYINTAQASGIVLYLDEIKLEEGSTATPYTEYGCGSIDYLARNKNLAFLEFSNKVRGYGNGNLTNSDIYDTYKAIVEENTKYTVSFVGNDNKVSNLCYFDKSMNYIKGEPFNTGNPRILTTPKNCIYITLAVNHDITNFMIEKGNTKTEYIEHKEQNIHIPLNKGQVIHKDDYIMNNRVHQNRKTVTLTGNETITRRGYVDSTNKTYRYSIELEGRDTSSRTNLICSHLPVDDQYSQNKSLIFGGGSNEGNIVYFQFVLDEIGVTDVTKISDYLKSQYENGTPVIVEYQLAKEIVTPLTKEQIEAFYELQKAKYVNKMELTCLNEIEPTLVDIEKSLEESLLDNEEAITNIKEQHEYSTEEQIVGTFLGKPLYRKVINCGSLPNNTQKIIQHNIENIDFIISCSGYAMTSTGSGLALPSYNGIINTNLYATTQQIGIVTTGDRSSFVKSYVVLEYTKTTD